MVCETELQAIKWAVKQKVDIISMSWTFERTETNGDAMERLREEIDKANKDQILMFSSTDDKGLTGPDQARVYPTCLKSQGIIRIGAATQSGAVSDWSGKEVDYVLPGENIEIDDPMSGHNAHLLEHPSSNASHHGHLTHPTATGSSYATALAAGVASMIIYCAEVALIHSKAKLEPGQAPIDRQYIRKWNRMKGAFSKMSVSQPGMPKYVKPWDHFATKYDRLDDEKAKEWLRGKVDELFNREKVSS